MSIKLNETYNQAEWVSKNGERERTKERHIQWALTKEYKFKDCINIQDVYQKTFY